jgi:putative DNA primase/helicase
MTNRSTNQQAAPDNVVPLRRPTPRRDEWEWTSYREFLMRLRGIDVDTRPMLIAIDPNDGRIAARTLSNGREINTFVAQWNAERNIYYAANATRGYLDKKAQKEDVYAIEYLLSDLDPVGAESPEAAKQRYLAQLESFTPRPTMLMDSGNGLQALWQLKTPILLGEPVQLATPIKVRGKLITRQFSPEDQAKIADVEARSAAFMRRLGAPTGTQNIDRILRLPGTLNLPSKAKREKGRVPCYTRLLWFEWSKYSLQEFPQAPAPQEESAGIPFVMTQAMKAALREAGYSDEQIFHMTPTQARETIRKHKGGNGAASPHRFKIPAGVADAYELNQTDSGYGFRFMRDRRREGMSFEQALEACLADKGQAGEWARKVDDRQHERAYERWDLYDEKKKKPTGEGWPEPKPLPRGLAPVAAFDTKFLPDALAPWVDDIAARLQCPPDYVGVSAVTALGSVIGRRVGIKPQAQTDWSEYPNLWAAFIGQPGMLKSPAMLQALAPLHRLEAEAAEDYKVQLEAYAKNLNAFKLKRQVWAALEKDALKKGTKAEKFDLDDAPEEPKAIRYRTNDTTYEKLGEILIGNPTGILIERDELVSLLQHLDREEQAQARSFFMTGWAGTHPYTFDRIIRGSLHIEAVCLSVLGNTQPTRISGYVRRASLDGGGGDGLIQRFQLLVWPDAPSSWNDIDQFPDSSARRKAWEVFERMSRLDAAELHKLGAHKEYGDKTYHYRFTDPAREEFVDWRGRLELRLRSGELSPALEGHFAKYRKLVPALALINHLADGGKGTVGRAALRKALAFSLYLESHALRVYGAADMVELEAAEAILAHIKAGDLADGLHRPRRASTQLVELDRAPLGAGRARPVGRLRLLGGDHRPAQRARRTAEDHLCHQPANVSFEGFEGVGPSPFFNFSGGDQSMKKLKKAIGPTPSKPSKPRGRPPPVGTEIKNFARENRYGKPWASGAVSCVGRC